MVKIAANKTEYGRSDEEKYVLRTVLRIRKRKLKWHHSLLSKAQGRIPWVQRTKSPTASRIVSKS